jgi:beta-glucosidase
MFNSIIKYVNMLAVIVLLMQGESNSAYAESLVLPSLMGFATSAYQNCGMAPYREFNVASNWSVHEYLLAKDKKHHLYTHGLSAQGTNMWDNVAEHIAMIKQVGGNTLRLSFDWTVFELRCGEFNEAAFVKAEQLIDALLDADIVPMVTLHHFVHPLWFEKMGGFTKEKNIKYFVHFSKKLFERLHKKVQLWCPINEIGAFVFQGYIQGVFPPAVSNPWVAAKVMRTMLKAHCAVYKELKAIDTTGQCQIGFVHNYLKFEPYDQQSWLHNFNMIEQAPCAIFNYIFNDAILHFLKTGQLFGYNPFLKMVIEDAPHCFDFIGLNFYSRVLIKSQIVQTLSTTRDFDKMVIPTGRADEPMTDMPFAIAPNSFYDAILEMATFGVPLYITENGAPDCSDTKRAFYIQSHLEILSKAIKQGINIKGYYYWTLVDNFEWDHGYTQQFGLYSYDRVHKTYALKDGAKIFKTLVEQAQRV